VSWSNLERKLSFNDVNRLFELASGKTGQQVNRDDLIVEKSAIPYGQW
jgi:hypothetical protein